MVYEHPIIDAGLNMFVRCGSCKNFQVIEILRDHRGDQRRVATGLCVVYGLVCDNNQVCKNSVEHYVGKKVYPHAW